MATYTTPTSEFHSINWDLPLSYAAPIRVNESTPNLEEIQNIPVVAAKDTVHYHQDPVSGQMYIMENAFHDTISQILANRMGGMGTAPTMTAPTMSGGMYTPVSVTTNKVTFIPTAPEKPIILVNGEPVVNTKQTVDTSNQFPIYRPFDYIDGTTSGVRQIETMTLYPVDDQIILSRTPINKIVNTISSTIQQLPLTKYVPINRFISLSQNLSSTNGGSTRYTPINKFYNR